MTWAAVRGGMEKRIITATTSNSQTNSGRRAGHALASIHTTVVTI